MVVPAKKQYAVALLSLAFLQKRFLMRSIFDLKTLNIFWTLEVSRMDVTNLTLMDWIGAFIIALGLFLLGYYIGHWAED